MCWELKFGRCVLLHGPNYQVLGFRIGNIAYCTDTSSIPEESFAVLEGCEVLILDTLRVEPHPTPFAYRSGAGDHRARAATAGLSNAHFTRTGLRSLQREFAQRC